MGVYPYYIVFNAVFISRLELEKSFEAVAHKFKANVTKDYQDLLAKYGEDIAEDIPFRRYLDPECQAAGMPFDYGWDNVTTEMANKCKVFTDWIK